MASWKPAFDSAVVSFRERKYDAALTQVSEAIRQGADRANVYDLRANILSECLGRPKEALKDAKMVIKLCPEAPKGYLRAAQIFVKLGSLEPASKMAEHALKCTSLDNPKHDSIRQSITALQAEIARKSCHVSKLPIELLTLVFELASILPVDEGNSGTMQGYLGGKRNPRLGYDVSRVCRYWRRAALEYPPIWRTLVLGNRKPSGKVQLWASRTGGNIEELIIRPGIHRHLLKEAIPDIVKHVTSPPRIIRCSAEEWDLLQEAVYPKPTGPTELNITADGKERILVPHLQGTGLQSLALDRVFIPWVGDEHSFCELKFLKLISPFLMNGNHEGFVERLAEAQNLETLIVERDPIQLITPTPADQIRITYAGLANLRFLELVRFPDDALQIVFSRFDFPLLEILHLQSVSKACASLRTIRRRLSPPPDPDVMEAELVELVPSALRTLRLRACTFDTKDLVETLGAQCSELEILEISGAGMEINPLLEALAGDRGAAVICPYSFTDINGSTSQKPRKIADSQ
ncbi:hypothetical protein M407DRAFT_227826 [Tulasnella calospora MUT 4182]|uniref:Uncharacterized protein n=1 Tax=Tulasnella calospora MUT 4182 TaxID=1051891 RepID=A0A0C3QN20_9AGAM|nr:hypothetical protein M407DRAFT_227826 [Tulasnella calospora MUT 4182]